MAWENYVTLFCDDCKNAAYMSDATTVSKARTDAPGWDFVNDNDLCPDCAATGGDN